MSSLQWSRPTAIKPGVGKKKSFAASTTIPDQLALLLTGAEVALRHGDTSGCWIGSVEFAVKGGPANLSVTVRGATEQTDGAQTTILVVIGAVLKSIAFEGARSGDFTETYQASISDSSKQTITIILLAERPEGAPDDLLLQVDSLDIVKA
jgi:hypothetical protein